MPAGRPAAGPPDLRAEPAGPRLLLGGRRARRRPLRDQRRGPGAGARRARARPERHQRRRPELAQPAHRLHARQRRDRGVRQPARRGRTDPLGASGSSDADQTQWAEGNAPAQDDLGEAVGGYETRVYFGENSPDYSVVGKATEGAPDVELDLRRATTSAEAEDGQASGSDAQTTYDGAGGVAGRLDVPPAALRDQVRQHELPAVGPGQREQRGDLQPRPARRGCRRSRPG